MSQPTREALSAQLDEITARLSRVTTHLRQPDGALSADSEEQAAELQGEEVLATLDDTLRLRAEGLRAAIVRIDDGTFGVCSACGGAIAPGRLLAMPEAATCVRCAT